MNKVKVLRSNKKKSKVMFCENKEGLRDHFWYSPDHGCAMLYDSLFHRSWNVGPLFTERDPRFYEKMEAIALLYGDSDDSN